MADGIRVWGCGPGGCELLFCLLQPVLLQGQDGQSRENAGIWIGDSLECRSCFIPLTLELIRLGEKEQNCAVETSDLDGFLENADRLLKRICSCIAQSW